MLGNEEDVGNVLGRLYVVYVVLDVAERDRRCYGQKRSRKSCFEAYERNCFHHLTLVSRMSSLGVATLRDTA